MSKFILSESIEREISVPEIFASLPSAQLAMATKLGKALDIKPEICLKAIQKAGVADLDDAFDDVDEMGVTALSAYCHVHHKNMDWKIHELDGPDQFLFVVSSRRDYPDSDESYFGADSIHTTQALAEQAIDADMDELLKTDLADEAGDCVVDRQNFEIQAGSKRFRWRIDPIVMPACLTKEG